MSIKQQRIDEINKGGLIRPVSHEMNRNIGMQLTDAQKAMQENERLRKRVEELEQRLQTAQQEPPTLKWETPDEFGLYEIFDDGSFQFLHDILFWALIPTSSKNEIHLCGVDESGLYGYDLNIEDRYDTGRSLEDVEYCMRYEQRG